MAIIILKEETVAPVELAGYVKLTARSGTLYLMKENGTEVALGEVGTTPYTQFTPQVAPPAHSEGLLYYDDNAKSLVLYIDDTEVSLNIGREMWERCRNNSGATITNGSVVYISGAIADLPTIALAQAGVTPPNAILGFATHDIENNTNGEITVFGLVHDINTSAFSAGDTVYLSDTTPGAITDTAPAEAISVGLVNKSHVTSGVISAHIQDANSYLKTIDASATRLTNTDSRETSHIATSSTFSVADGNVQQRTAAGNETIEVNMATSDASIMIVDYIPGPHTISIGTSIDEWVGGSPPATIEAKHRFVFTSTNGGTTVTGQSVGLLA